MRIIERDAIQAMRDCQADPAFSGTRFRRANTAVKQCHKGIHHTAGYDRWTELILHNTAVVTYYPFTEQLKLNSGGFRTNTTKSRINAVLDALKTDWRIQQIKGQWFLCDLRLGNLFLFKDGVSVQTKMFWSV